ncbi:MAG TPA: hypothetical protein VM580_24470 [Labilithrix sp.]|nr:hypothetical protein [Labilithrix sp.]
MKNKASGKKKLVVKKTTLKNLTVRTDTKLPEMQWTMCPKCGSY